jgi:Zn finger protein HypA/HybF involved in hydrogenase expression
VPERGIEFKPDADDPKRVKLYRGLPQGVSRAEITYRAGGGFRGTRLVRCSEAEFAQLRTAVDGVYEGPWSEARQVTVSEARHYIDQAQRRIEQQEAEIRRRRESVDLTCPWCERQRTYLGILGFITGHAGFMTDHPSELGQQVVQQHAYRCDRCGSMQLFADGFLSHPLPGRKPS